LIYIAAGIAGILNGDDEGLRAILKEYDERPYGSSNFIEKLPVGSENIIRK
jgi:hypothetical protein